MSRFTLKAIRKKRAPTAVMPAVGCTAASPKSGARSGVVRDAVADALELAAPDLGEVAFVPPRARPPRHRGRSEHRSSLPDALRGRRHGGGHGVRARGTGQRNERHDVRGAHARDGRPRAPLRSITSRAAATPLHRAFDDLPRGVPAIVMTLRLWSASLSDAQQRRTRRRRMLCATDGDDVGIAAVRDVRHALEKDGHGRGSPAGHRSRATGYCAGW